jgi:hypothetical protein
MKGFDLSKIDAHDTGSRHDALNDGGEGAERGPHSAAVTVGFGVQKNEGGEGRRQGESGWR